MTADFKSLLTLISLLAAGVAVVVTFLIWWVNHFVE